MNITLPSQVSSSDDTRAQRPRANRAACATCHLRKIKCDAATEGFPCTNCRKHFRSDCVWHQKRKRAAVRSPHNPIPIRQAAPASLESFPPPETPADELHSYELPLPRATNNGEAQARTSEATPGYALIDDGAQGCKRHLVEFIDQEDLSYRPIDRAARIAYVGTDVSNINFLVRQSDQRTIVHHFPANRIDRRYTAHEPDRLPVEAFQLPEKAVVDELLQTYFQKINPGFPVVDEERFMGQYRARDPADPPSLLLLHSILLVGAHVLPGRTALKSDFFRRAKILIDSRFERNRDVIVQAALLLTWYSDGLEDVAANAWYWIGFAARIAMGLGMHRDAEPSTLVHHNKKMWRRVWWLLVQCDLLVSLQFGRPLSINLDDCDVQPPKRSDYEGCGPNTEIDYAIATTELCIIICRIYRKCFGPRANSFNRHETLSEADEELARWSLLLPQYLRLRPTLTLDLWPASLHLMYNTALILLHRPRPQMMDPSSPSNLPDQNDAEICSAAAGVIQSIFESLSERRHLSCLWVFSVTALFTAMIQLSVEVRFANPLLAIAAVRRYDSTLYSLRKLTEYWPNAESILHFFEHSERLQRQNVHLEGLSGSPNQLLASPGVTKQTVDGSTSISPPTVTAQASPSAAFGGPLHSHLPHETTPLNQARQDGEPNEDDTDIARNWRQLFPFTDAFDAEAIRGAAFLENWNEAYWQEPFDLGAEFEM